MIDRIKGLLSRLTRKHETPEEQVQRVRRELDALPTGQPFLQADDGPQAVIGEPPTIIPVFVTFAKPEEPKEDQIPF